MQVLCHTVKGCQSWACKPYGVGGVLAVRIVLGSGQRWIGACMTVVDDVALVGVIRITMKESDIFVVNV